MPSFRSDGLGLLPSWPAPVLLRGATDGAIQLGEAVAQLAALLCSCSVPGCSASAASNMALISRGAARPGEAEGFSGAAALVGETHSRRDRWIVLANLMQVTVDRLRCHTQSMGDAALTQTLLVERDHLPWPNGDALLQCGGARLHSVPLHSRGGRSGHIIKNTI